MNSQSQTLLACKAKSKGAFEFKKTKCQKSGFDQTMLGAQLEIEN